MFFEVHQLHRADADVGDGLTGWWVDLPGISFRGKVVVPEDWTVARVHEGLEAAAVRFSYDVLCGRLYSRTRLDELVRHQDGP